MKPVDFLIVGSGLLGSVVAYELNKKGKSVLVIDKRSEIGGNCIDYLDNGIFVSKYGGHFFHTNSEYLYKYVTSLTEWYPYYLKVKVNSEDIIYSYPINLLTLNQLWGITTPEEAKRVIENKRIPIEKPDNLEEMALSLVGEELYYKFIYGYSTKQWKVDPKNLYASLMKRIPVRFDFNDNYFTDKFQLLPVNGFISLFESLLKGIEVKLNTTFDKSMLNMADKVIYTGGIDTYYDYVYGDLEYITSYRIWNNDDIGSAGINYPDMNVPFLRQFSYGYNYPYDSSYHVTSTEYTKESTRDSEKDYPINTTKNNDLHRKYKEIPNDKVIFSGRLSSYQYINMDQCVAMALKLVEKLC